MALRGCLDATGVRCIRATAATRRLRGKGVDTVSSELDQAFKLHRQGRLRDAEELCQRILRREPREFGALHLLGALKLHQDQPAEATKLFAAALAIDPGSTAAHANQGLALAALNRPDEALASYAQALRIDPANAEALANQGDALCDLGRLPEALASYDQALAINPRLVQALVNKGLALRALGQRE